MRRLHRHYAYLYSVRLKLPKPGYTTIVVKESVRSHLQKLAKAQGYRSINQLLEAWVGVYPGVNPTGINGEIRRQETNPETSPFPKKQFNLVVDRAGFEPATSAVRGRHSFQTELPARHLG